MECFICLSVKSTYIIPISELDTDSAEIYTKTEEIHTAGTMGKAQATLSIKKVRNCREEVTDGE
jgi:hypothetical protein